MSKLILNYAGLLHILLLLVLVFTGNFFSANPLVISGQALGLALVIYARVAFGRQKFNISARPADGPLLRRGPYRVIRHPMYAGVSLLMVATVIGHLSVFPAAIAILDITVIQWRIRIEEDLLKSAYPEYAEYAVKTARIIPYLY